MNITCDQARQSLIDGIAKEELAAVILLLAHGKISTDDLNQSCIHLAASQGNVTILQLLLWVNQRVQSSVSRRSDVHRSPSFV
jgi:hypothetical protein